MSQIKNIEWNYRMILKNKKSHDKNTKGIKVRKAFTVALSAILCLSCFTACGKDENKSGTRVVFTTGFGKDEVFRIEDATCTKGELMVYLTTTQNQYEDVYGTEIWNVSLDDVTLEENVKDTVLAKAAQIKTMYLLAKEKDIALEEAEEKRWKRLRRSIFRA